MIDKNTTKKEKRTCVACIKTSYNKNEWRRRTIKVYKNIVQHASRRRAITVNEDIVQYASRHCATKVNEDVVGSLFPFTLFIRWDSAPN